MLDWRHHNAARSIVYSAKRQAAAAIALTLTGCSGPLSTLQPAGPAAQSIASLWWAMLAGSVLLFVLVMALFALVILLPATAARLSPTRWIVLGGLTLPAVVLTPLIIYALITGERLLPGRDIDPVRVEAEARQWQWAFRYPGFAGIETANVLHLPAGVPIDVAVTSRDVIHAFWIPRVAGKIDAIPGHTNVLRLLVDKPGVYKGRCNEFCGIGHTEMAFDIVVHPKAAFPAAIIAAGKVPK